MRHATSWLFSIFVSVGLLLLSLPAHAADLDQVVNRYLSWRGGAAFENLASLHQKGLLEDGGLHGRDELWAERGGRSRIDTDLGPLKQTQTVNGSNSWDTSPSEQVETLSLADHRSNARSAALQFSEAISGRDGATVALAGTQTRAGRTWAVVRISFGDEDTYDAYIDPSTGELDGFRITEDRQTRFEGYGDWRFVRGVRMPFLHTTDDDTRELVAGVELNSPFLTDLFKRPKLSPKATFSDDSGSTDWIKFELYGGNRIFFPVKVDGRTVNAMLDSGATISSVDKGWAKSIGLASQGRFAGAGTGGVDTFGFIHGVDVEVGNVRLNKLTLASFDFSSVATSIGRPVPFVLGDEIFNELLVDIDFAHQRIAFRKLPPPQASQPGVQVPLIRVKDRAVPVSIEGAPPAPFEFDIGSGSPLQIFPSFEAKHHLLADRLTSQTWFGGVGGYTAMTVAMVKTFKFAGVDFPAAPAVFTPNTRSGSNSNLVQGNFGLPVYARFHILIDFPHDRLWTLPNADALASSFSVDRLGLYLMPEANILEVRFVSPGSPAEKSSIQLGDSVLSINGRPASSWTQNALRSLRGGAAGSDVSVVLVNGDVRRIVLADFY